ncbi:kinesin motor domain-containing protein [Artemisia annua]|uniref:Kinesin motor domain-containing protein n=1 Tax=Artemisia annua TaxID=35608 RepID=A0A2U1MXR9_ARTAN|nr:kinesin motor domain-containing protein [Artemisia annua]
MVDCCYGQSEDNAAIFSKEVKPRISKAFDGESSTFIAFGARGSGKTYTIQGTDENFGLGMLAIEEVLRNVEGERHTIAVSIYEVLQNHVYDLLDTNNKEVQILEDAQGKITLKGLSKVHVKSMAEFQKLYCGESSSKRPTKKLPLELPRRSHKALMIHILASDEGENAKCAGTLNFVDLAGYENTRSSIDGTNCVEVKQINKSLNALLNVIQAINASESRVPYRESKVARMLQDSVGGTNNISMLVCLNPLFCPDTLHAITLASRLKIMKPVTMSCFAKKPSNSRVPMSLDKTDPGVSSCSTSKKPTTPRYPLSAKKPSSSCVPLSANKPNPGVSVSSSTKKQTNLRFPLSAKKTNAVVKGRKLFGGVGQAKGIKEQALSMENNESSIMKSEGDTTVATSIMKSEISSGDFMVVPYVKEEKCSLTEASSSSASVPQPLDEEILEYDASKEMESLVMKLEDTSVETQNTCTEFIPYANVDNMEKENNALHANEGQSPPLSVQLKEMAKNLQLTFNASTPLCISRPLDAKIEVGNCVEAVEPKTPVVAHNMDLSICESGTFSKHGIKESLVQDYLRFLNSASKDNLKSIRGIGEKRATYILDLREESPEPFKSLDDLQDIGLSAKQVKKMIKNVASDLFA